MEDQAQKFQESLFDHSLHSNLMDLWTFRRFQEPFLAVDSVDYEPGTHHIYLKTGQHSYCLYVDQPDTALSIAAQLSCLRDKTSPLWQEINSADEASPWVSLCTFFDTHSLVSEGHHNAEVETALQAKRIWECALSTTNATFKDLSKEQWNTITHNAKLVLHDLDTNFETQKSLALLEDPFDINQCPNFYLALIKFEIDYLRRASPLTLTAFKWLLEYVIERDQVKNYMPDITSMQEAVGLYDESDLASHLSLLANCLLRSIDDSARRLKTAKVDELKVTNGLDFMRQIEVITRDTLDLWGENKYISSINRQGGPSHPLTTGPFIEQYHVTRRFLEIIAPQLHTRFSPRLRQMFFQYYSEESGHEALESTTCESLGVSLETLSKIKPLPLHYAFVDMLTWLALNDPISSFASIMAIEGVYGEPPKMSMRLASAAEDKTSFNEVIKVHDDLNENLNHNSISRDLFEQIKSVNIKQQQQTIRRILFLIELNHRAWTDIEKFYGSQESLRVNGLYNTLLNPQTGIID
jgi:hypothetical protein